MNKVYLSEYELNNIVVGEAITLAAVVAVMIIAILAVAAYKMFTSEESVIKLPGGYQFSWG